MVSNTVMICCSDFASTSSSSDNKVDFGDSMAFQRQVGDCYKQAMDAVGERMANCYTRIKSMIEQSSPDAISTINWDSIRGTISSMNVVIISDTFICELNSKYIQETLNLIVDFLSKNVNFNNKEDIDTLTECSSWMDEYGNCLSPLRCAFQSDLMSKMESTISDTKKLDENGSISDFEKLIKRLKQVASGCNHKRLIVDAKKLQAQMNRLVGTLKFQLSCTITRIVHTTIDLGRDITNLSLEIEKLHALKANYTVWLYLNKVIMDIIQNKCLAIFCNSNGTELKVQHKKKDD